MSKRSAPEWRSKPWAEQDAARVGQAVARLRGKTRSGQWLSDRTHELGHRVSRTMISELENGKRAYISTTELIVLAAALNVAPVALLYPAPYEEEIEVLPGVRMLTIAAAERFSGNIDPLMFDHDEEFVSNMLELSRARQLREIQRSRRNLAEQLKITGDVIPGSVRETLQVEHARLSKLYAELRSEYGG